MHPLRFDLDVDHEVFSSAASCLCVHPAGNAHPLRKVIMAALWYLATGGTFREVAQVVRENVSPSTVMRNVRVVTRATLVGRHFFHRYFPQHIGDARQQNMTKHSHKSRRRVKQNPDVATFSDDTTNLYRDPDRVPQLPARRAPRDAKRIRGDLCDRLYG